MRQCIDCGAELSIIRPGAKRCLDCAETKKRGINKQRIMDGGGHNSYKFTTFREKALVQQGPSCIICGWSYDGADSGGCIVHHIIPVSDNGTSSNQVNAAVLCPNCHVRAHHNAFTVDFLQEMAQQARQSRAIHKFDLVRKIIG
jgi:rubredoxin